MGSVKVLDGEVDKSGVDLFWGQWLGHLVVLGTAYTFLQVR